MFKFTYLNALVHTYGHSLIHTVFILIEILIMLLMATRSNHGLDYLKYCDTGHGPYELVKWPLGVNSNWKFVKKCIMVPTWDAVVICRVGRVIMIPTWNALVIGTDGRVGKVIMIPTWDAVVIGTDGRFGRVGCAVAWQRSEGACIHGTWILKIWNRCHGDIYNLKRC